ncbi:MAG: DMT family transporter [Myxococcota bacterium]
MSASSSTSGQASASWLGDFIALGAIWGSSFLFIRYANGSFGPLAVAALRVSIASVALMPLLLSRRLQGELWEHRWALLVNGILNAGIPYACYAFALLSLSSGLAAILNATTPMFGALVAWVWLGERPTGIRGLGLVLGFGGVAALAWDKASLKPDASGIAPGWAVLACLVATLCYGIAGSQAKRYLSGRNPLVTATGSQTAATLVLAIPALLHMPTEMPGLNAWGAILALGVMCTGVAYVLFFRIIERGGPTRALAVTFLIPVFAVIYGVVFMGEHVSLKMLGCGAIILLGTALSTGVLGLRKPTAEKPSPR